MQVAHRLEDAWELFRDSQRAGIAEAIIALIGEQDEPVTIAEISQRAGISRPTFYKYFPRLGAAMLYVHLEVIDAITRHAQAAVAASAGAGIGKVLAGFGAFKDLVLDRPDLIRFTSYFDFTFRRHGLSTEERRQLHDVERERSRFGLASFLDGQRDGSIKSELDAEETLQVMSLALVGLAQRLVVTIDEPDAVGVDVDAAFEVALEVWRRYLLSVPEPR